MKVFHANRYELQTCYTHVHIYTTFFSSSFCFLGGRASYWVDSYEFCYEISCACICFVLLSQGNRHQTYNWNKFGQLTFYRQMIMVSLVYQYYYQLEEADRLRYILFRFAGLDELRSPGSQLLLRWIPLKHLSNYPTDLFPIKFHNR